MNPHANYQPACHEGLKPSSQRPPSPWVPGIFDPYGALCPSGCIQPAGNPASSREPHLIHPLWPNHPLKTPHLVQSGLDGSDQLSHGSQLILNLIHLVDELMDLPHHCHCLEATKMKEIKTQKITNPPQHPNKKNTWQPNDSSHHHHCQTYSNCSHHGLLMSWWADGTGRSLGRMLPMKPSCYEPSWHEPLMAWDPHGMNLHGMNLKRMHLHGPMQTHAKTIGTSCSLMQNP